MQGILEEYNYDRQLSYFRSGDLKSTKKVLICIGGLSNGLLSLPYIYPLNEKLQSSSGFSLIQPLFSSSYGGWGTSSLAKDCEELDLLLEHLKTKHSVEFVVLLGHSTGAQNSVYYMKHGKNKQLIRAIILQGGVSDREFSEHNKERSFAKPLSDAKSLISSGKQEELMARDVYGTPVTAYRFFSLESRLGDDDYFSSDFSDSEREERLGHLKGFPVFIAFSNKDQYVPPAIDKQKLCDGMAKTIGLKTTKVKLYEGNHSLEDKVVAAEFATDVVTFISQI